MIRKTLIPEVIAHKDNRDLIHLIEFPVSNTIVRIMGESTMEILDTIAINETNMETLDEEIENNTHLINVVVDQTLRKEKEEEKTVQLKSQIRVATKKENGVIVTTEKINIRPIKKEEIDEEEKITQATAEVQVSRETERKGVGNENVYLGSQIFN